MELKDLTSNNKNIIIKFEGDKKYLFKIISIDTGLELKSIFHFILSCNFKLSLK